MKTHYQNAKFLISAAALSQLPADTGYEVAFAGRSNAGKSSTLNVLCLQNQLAKVSKTPGRTRLINIFTLDEERRLVDLPGYGYAKVAASTKARWQATLARYLEMRACLKGVFLIMDIRHPLKELDQNFIHWTDARDLPLHILLNKADKLSHSQASSTLLQVRKALKEFPCVSVQLFSAMEKKGIEEAWHVLDQWYGLGLV
jgi:GTP-binding protein